MTASILADEFIAQCCNYVRNIYNYDDYVNCCKEIENDILERVVYYEEGEYKHFFTPDNLHFISQEWWESYDEIEDYNEQKLVHDYIKDTWPDVWRP